MDEWDSRLGLLLSLRRYQEGARASREAIAAHPDWADGYFYLARFLEEEGALQDARAAARAGLGKDPQSAWGHGVLALCQFKLGRHEEAIAAAREGIRLDPKYAFAYGLLAEVHYRNKRFQAAQRVATDGLLHRPDDENLLHWYGWASLKLKAIDVALSTAEAGLRLHPRSSLHRNLLSAVLLDRNKPGDVERAETLAREVVQLDPTEYVFRKNLAISARRLEQARGGEGSEESR